MGKMSDTKKQIDCALNLACVKYLEYAQGVLKSRAQSPPALAQDMLLKYGAQVEREKQIEKIAELTDQVLSFSQREKDLMQRLAEALGNSTSKK
jgi:hypothetical protein